MAETIYGLLLMIFIIFLPAGIYGSLRDLLARRSVAGRRPVATA
jgi:ABC-type branched-subunit amino acid transport system permease subunit